MITWIISIREEWLYIGRKWGAWWDWKVDKALFELEVNRNIKAQLRELHITAAKEVDCSGGKIILYIIKEVKCTEQAKSASLE